MFNKSENQGSFVDNYELDHSESEFDSEYDMPVNTESSMDSVDSETDYEEPETSGFKRLDADSSKKRLLIKDGKIVKTSDKRKLKKNIYHFSFIHF